MIFDVLIQIDSNSLSLLSIDISLECDERTHYLSYQYCLHSCKDSTQLIKANHETYPEHSRILSNVRIQMSLIFLRQENFKCLINLGLKDAF